MSRTVRPDWIYYRDENITDDEQFEVITAIEHREFEWFLKQLRIEQVLKAINHSMEWTNGTGYPMPLFRQFVKDKCRWFGYRLKPLIKDGSMDLSPTQWDTLRATIVKHQNLIRELTLAETIMVCRRYVSCNASILLSLSSRFHIWK